MKLHQTIFISMVTVGFILSPLTWWNDLFINVPLAYIITIPFTFIDKKLFLPSFIAGYWLTNLVGLLLLHWGSLGLLQKPKALHLKHIIVISLVYTSIIAIMVLLGWIAPPTEYLDKFI